MQKRIVFGPEIKVGIFVLAGLLLLAYLSARLGEVRLGEEKGYRIWATFESVSGLVKESPVEMAGIEIGRVKDVRLANGKAKVEMLISPKVRIGKDAEAVIRTKGVLGDKFIEIKQGKARDVISPNGTIARTVSPPGLDELLTKVGPAVEEIQAVASGINQFIGDRSVGNDFRNLLSNLKDASASIKKVSGDIEAGGGTLGRLIQDDSLYVQTEKTMGVLHDVARRVEKGEGTLGKLVRDDTLYETAKETLNSIHDVTQKVAKGQGTLGRLISDDSVLAKAESAVDSLHNVAQKIDKGEGTLGKLVNDPSLYDEAKKAVRSVNKAASDIQEQVPVTILGTVVGTVVR
ncbi:MAG: MlaD family protein [Pseudomonadota bacterium]